MNTYKTKANLKNSAAGIKKENLLLTHYSHFYQSLKEAKNVARTFSMYFEKNKFKNETRELATNVTAGYIVS